VQGRVTLSRALSKYGVCSRSEGRRLILAGEVSVNGARVLTPDKWVDPDSDAIACGGKPLGRSRRIYIALHKPAGFVTTRSDEKGRSTVYDLLPPGLPWIFPVGRLDRDSTGLLLLTNDTAFGERVTGPSGKVPKTYRVLLKNPLDDAGAAAIRAGVQIGDEIRCRPGRVTIEEDSARRCLIEITEGKNRQVRRMFEALGNRVLSLHRLAIGPVEIGTLKEGQTRELTRNEIALLSGEKRGDGHA
jgi:23S rRNA pseudouridine2605 synthase